MSNKDKPAYPIFDENGSVWEEGSPFNGKGSSGLTKREAFAMAAMQGMIANPEYFNATMDDLADMAALQADALLKRLEYE